MKLAVVNFLDISQSSFDKARVVIVPFAFEATTSYGQGTAKGPAAIIKASAQVELFDEELWRETYKKINIATLKEIKPAKAPAKAKAQILPVIKKILADNKLPIVLGGEHSITSFVVEEFKNFYPEFSILQFDAHADLRDGYLGQKYSHASAMRRCLDLAGINLVQIGVRNISNENDELNYWKNNQDRIKTFWAKDVCEKRKIHANGAHANLTREIVNSLKENVYLTFDVDAFDPAIMPSTGTPEPGGLDWYETLDILCAVCKNKKIIGADFVELSPIKNIHAPDFLIAKLIYRTIGYLLR